MSGIAAIFDRSGAPVDPAALERVVSRLERPAPDGRDAYSSRNVAIGHRHFWTTPEEVGERQPMRLQGMPFTVAFDGRLDNRRELCRELAISDSEAATTSDACLSLRAYDRWGSRCLERLVGEYALVIHDERSGELLLARDAMGERTLFYRFDGSLVLVASEPAAISRDSGGVELDPAGAAHFFSFEKPDDGRTLFRGVRELLPAEVMVVDADGERRWRHWEPDFTTRIRGRSDEEYASEFLTLLEESVRCRIRSATPVGVQMSGGLDSASVASLAARLLAPNRLTTISYVFDELSECDEREYIGSMLSRWNIRAIEVQGDDAWPFRDFDNWPRDPNRPEIDPFRLLKLRVFRAAASEGIRVLLTGAYADELYCRGTDWLADLIAEGKFGEAAREVTASLRRDGFRRTMTAPSTRRACRRLLEPLIARRRPAVTSEARYPWLTSNAAGSLIRSLRANDAELEMKQTLTRVRAYESTINPGSSAIELRHPFRDRRLVEYVLKLPAHQSFNRGVYKHVLRTAMHGILPELIRTRRNRTLISALYFRGMERERHQLKGLLEQPDAGWREHVREEWMAVHWDPSANRNEQGAKALVPWMCAAWESWISPAETRIISDGAPDASR